ncbi:uroporphyrinogen-III C-methyltransferase [Antricoccus suffuscus]|uniref:uroporphyrinogen-III C-methyltransferase n=1 Tax=Antricoccus suffuscus TaxID=1629062 RepID=A0A2T1A7H4_9ACTN|nr:uroporphyrinogen-III C-methyltransferase [Antricoccus suffuscus]PRZ44288.1 uroporphyrinogen-III C-methyltransferase [Antricoccus suffuscus]
MTTLVGLELAGRAVLVAGGGPVAARRIAQFVADGADVLVVAPEICEDLTALVTDGAVAWRPDTVRDSDLDGVWLVHTATGDRWVDRQIAEWAENRRVWCVNAGSAAHGTARTPATTRSGDVLVGVVTDARADGDGGDPRRVAAIRDDLADHLRSGEVDQRRRRTGPGRVVLVGGGPGASDLLTVKARRLLDQADVVVTDRLGPISALDRLPADVEVINVGKAPGDHPVPQHEINRILVERAQRGQFVVRLKGGDPFVFGRGAEEVFACREAGIAVEMVPGVSSALSVPALAGIPLTHRGLVASFQVANGHDPLGPGALRNIRDRTATLVVLMGVSMLAHIVEQAIAAGADPELPVAIVENGASDRERVTRASLSRIICRAREVRVVAPAVIVIGDVAELDLRDFSGAA